MDWQTLCRDKMNLNIAYPTLVTTSPLTPFQDHHLAKPGPNFPLDNMSRPEFSQPWPPLLIGHSAKAKFEQTLTPKMAELSPLWPPHLT